MFRLLMTLGLLLTSLFSSSYTMASSDEGYFIKTASGKSLQVLLRNRGTDKDKLFNLRGKEVLGIHIKGDTFIAVDNGRIVVDARPRNSGKVKIVRHNARSKVVTKRTPKSEPDPRRVTRSQPTRNKVKPVKRNSSGFIARTQKRSGKTVKFYGKVDKNNHARGCGAIRYPNGDLYIGHYYRNRRHGQGVSFFNKKGKFVLRNDNHGKLTTKRNIRAVKITNNQYYFGNTRKRGNRQVPHGFGVMRYAGHKYISGQFNNGKLVKNRCTFTRQHFK